MKKNLRNILCLLLALCMVISFTACEEEDDEGDDENDKPELSDEKKESTEEEWELSIKKESAGTYVIYSIMDGSELMLPSDLELVLKEYGLSRMKYLISIEISKYGEVTLCAYGDTKKMEYDEYSMWPVGDKDNKMGYFLTGDTLTLLQDDVMMTLKKE